METPMQIDSKHLLALAGEAAHKAYAPYSKFHVGACVLYTDGSIYTGCNVENASYGLSLCAERNAISSAIADGQKGEILAIAIYSPDMESCYPCGACRQWISEFSGNAKIILSEKIEHSIQELIPYSFDFRVKEQ